MNAPGHIDGQGSSRLQMNSIIFFAALVVAFVRALVRDFVDTLHTIAAGFADSTPLFTEGVDMSVVYSAGLEGQYLARKSREYSWLRALYGAWINSVSALFSDVRRAFGTTDSVVRRSVSIAKVGIITTVIVLMVVLTVLVSNSEISTPLTMALAAAPVVKAGSRKANITDRMNDQQKTALSMHTIKEFGVKMGELAAEWLQAKAKNARKESYRKALLAARELVMQISRTLVEVDAFAHVKVQDRKVMRFQVNGKGKLACNADGLPISNVVEEAHNVYSIKGMLGDQEIVVQWAVGVSGLVDPKVIIRADGKMIKVDATAGLIATLRDLRATEFDVVPNGDGTSIVLNVKGIKFATRVLLAARKRLVYHNARGMSFEVLSVKEMAAIKATNDPRGARLVQVVRKYTMVDRDDKMEVALCLVEREAPRRPIMETVAKEIGMDIVQVTWGSAVTQFIRNAAGSVATREALVDFQTTQMMGRGMEFAGFVKGRAFYGDKGSVKAMASLLGFDAKNLGNWTRLAVVLKRTTGATARQVEFAMPGQHLSAKLDGTIAVGAGLPFGQGTAIAWHTDDQGVTTLYIWKGVIRSQGVVRTGSVVKVEREGMSAKAEFGRVSPTDGNVTFWYNNVASVGEVFLSLQTILFNMEDLTTWLKGETARIVEGGVVALLGEETAAKVALGVPFSVLVRGLNPFRAAISFKRNGARVFIVGLDVTEEGEELVAVSKGDGVLPVRLSVAGHKAIKKYVGKEVVEGDVVQIPASLLRDPATPGGTGRISIRYCGLISFTRYAGEFVIAISANSSEWNDWLAGDFDGDAGAIVKDEAHDTWRKVNPATVALLAQAKQALRLGGSKITPTDALVARMMGAAGGDEFDGREAAKMLAGSKGEEIGRPTLIAARLVFEGRLDEEVPAEAMTGLRMLAHTNPAAAEISRLFEAGLPATLRIVADLWTQGSIDDIKHPINAEMIAWCETVMVNAIDFRMVRLFNAWYEFKSFAGTPVERAAAWAKLVVAAKADWTQASEQALAGLILAVEDVAITLREQEKVNQQLYVVRREQAGKVYDASLEVARRMVTAPVGVRGAAALAFVRSAVEAIDAKASAQAQIVVQLAGQWARGGHLLTIAVNTADDALKGAAIAEFDGVRRQAKSLIAAGKLDARFAFSQLPANVAGQLLPLDALQAVVLLNEETATAEVQTMTDLAPGTYSAEELKAVSFRRYHGLIDQLGSVTVVASAAAATFFKLTVR